jgi:hypothetical protein
MVADLLLFQTIWFICVWSAAHGYPWAGVLAVAGRAGFSLRGSSVPPRREALLLLSAAAIGLLGEWILGAAEVLDYPPQARTGPPVPAWMIALWVNFATLLHTSLAWLRGRFVLAAMLGAIAAPLSYWAGRRLGAILLHPEPVVWICGIGLLWAVATPVLVWIAEATAA